METSSSQAQSPSKRATRPGGCKRQATGGRQGDNKCPGGCGKFFCGRPKEGLSVRDKKHFIRYADEKHMFHVNHMCRILHVNEAGYYQWKNRQSTPSKRELLSAAIKEIMDENELNKNYGVTRWGIALVQRGMHASPYLIRGVMDTLGLLHKVRQPQGCTKVSKEQKEEENLIKGDFKAGKPFIKSLSDITEVAAKDDKLFVTVALDCFDGSVLAISMDTNMKKELCINLVHNMEKDYGPKIKGMIHHSDRGTQYTSHEFREELKNAGMRQSLCSRYHCFDNSRMESFWATLKKELIYQLPTHEMTVEELKTAIFEYIFTYYNRVRVNTFNPDGLPPAVYRERYEQEHNREEIEVAA